MSVLSDQCLNNCLLEQGIADLKRMFLELKKFSMKYKLKPNAKYWIKVWSKQYFKNKIPNTDSQNIVYQEAKPRI